MTVYRNVASLILAVMLLQAASGILSVSTPLALSYMGASSLGVGMVAATDGKASRRVVEAAIEALRAVWHRGAVDADGCSRLRKAGSPIRRPARSAVASWAFTN